MTLRQLRYLVEIVRQGLHLSHAAEALHTSQPGVSRQIQLLEEELGLKVLQRRRNRILGLTQPGKQILAYAQKILRDTDSVQNLGAEIKNVQSGHLVIATNHTHARYTLPRVITAFTEEFPNVHLEFWQGNRNQAFKWLDAGEVNIAIGTDSDLPLENSVLFPCGKFHRIAVTPPKHPLLKITRPTLRDIAQYRLITHGFRTDNRWKFKHAFEAIKVRPHILFSALDADVSKSYVELGLGIAILPHVTFDAVRDPNLRAIDLRHLLPAETMKVGINKEQFHRQYVFKFLELLSPDLTRRKVERVLASST